MSIFHKYSVHFFFFYNFKKKFNIYVEKALSMRNKYISFKLLVPTANQIVLYRLTVNFERSTENILTLQSPQLQSLCDVNTTVRSTI